VAWLTDGEILTAIQQSTVPEGKVVVFDDDHYYMGNVLAEALVAQGVEVCFVTPESLESAWLRQTPSCWSLRELP